jgi:hypothetical protein
MFINGKPVDLSTRHTRLYEKFNARHKRLSAANASVGKTGRKVAVETSSGFLAFLHLIAKLDSSTMDFLDFDFDPKIERGSTLPARLYTDPRVLAREAEDFQLLVAACWKEGPGFESG